MTTFNVHFTRADGTTDSRLVDAETPKDAASSITKKFPGARIDKTKRWKAPADANEIGGGA